MGQQSIIKALMILLPFMSPIYPANAANLTFSVMPISLHAAEHKSLISAAQAPTRLASAYLQGSGAASPTETISLLNGLASATSIRSLQTLGRQEASGSHAKQMDSVPLSVAAWLFASALLGFVVVANRRKV